MARLLSNISPTLKIQLDCGKSVQVEAFMYDHTYSCLLEGAPSEGLNAWIIQCALTRHEALWGQRQIHLTPPPVDRSDVEHPFLPRLNLHVWLTCSEPANSMFHGSELVVTWFAEDCHTQPLAEVISDAIRHLPWEQLARDFKY